MQIDDYVKRDISPDIDDVVSNIGQRSIVSLKESIQDIENLIVSRQELHTKLIADIEKVEMDISNFLLNKPMETPREELMLFKEKKIELAESKRQEKLACWQDVAKLKEEQRALNRELIDKQSRSNMLSSIIK